MQNNPTVDSTRESVPRCLLCLAEADGLAFPYETLWQGRHFTYHGCRSCGSTSIFPVPSPTELAAVYTWDRYHSVHFAVEGLARHEDSVDFLESNVPGRRRILDYGCGDGGFLIAAARRGHECAGVEYEASTVENVHRRTGLPVYRADALPSLGDTFDVVHLNDVLTHLPDPAGALRRLEKLLSPNGVFFIEGPLENNVSVASLVASTAKRARRVLKRDRIPTIAPTMLTRTTRDGQLDFFRRRLALEVRRFEVYETGWPYYVENRVYRSPTDVLKQALGLAAVALARLDHQHRLGNRFRSILAPTSRPIPAGDTR